MQAINRNDYPQLDQLLWDTRAIHLEPAYALDMYERRWEFVDQNAITDNEAKLIKALAARIGNTYIQYPTH